MKTTEYRLFGRTGVRVSPLTLGCMMFGGRTTPAESARIIDRSLDVGINILDTANGYSRGASEEAVGAALHANGRRDRVFLCTKVFMTMDDIDPNQQGTSRRHIIEQCEASLIRLRVDYIDLYQIHRPQPGTAIDESLRALDDLVRSGKVRYIGSSTFAGWQLVEALWASKELGLNRFVSEQPPYNLLDRRIERELIPAAQTFGLALLAWSPLGGGILTGKYRRAESKPANTRYSSNPTPVQARSYTEGMFDVVEPLEQLAKEKGISLAQLALAWVMRQPSVTSTIIGPRTFEQFEDNLSACDVEFNESDLERINAIIPPGTHASPFYEADFSASRYRW